MAATDKGSVDLFVDKNSQQWVVRDDEGNFWRLPTTDNPWDKRQPFEVAEETELAFVPGHYKYMLGLPMHAKARGP